MGPQKPDVWGNHHRATWSRPGQPEQEAVAAAYPLRPTHHRLACRMTPVVHLTGRQYSHPAALSLAKTEARLEEGLPDDVGPGFRWVRAFGMREGATSKAEWAVRWGRWATSAIVCRRRKSSHVGREL